MEKEEKINQLVSFLHEIEQDGELSREEKQTVMIEGAINLKEMCDHVVTCSHGDIVLIVSMLHDYVKMLDELRSVGKRGKGRNPKFLIFGVRVTTKRAIWFTICTIVRTAVKVTKLTITTTNIALNVDKRLTEVI